MDFIVSCINCTDAGMERSGVEQKTGKLRVLSIAGYRLSNIRDGIEFLRSFIGDFVSLLADISRRPQTDPKETTGKLINVAFRRCSFCNHLFNKPYLDHPLGMPYCSVVSIVHARSLPQLTKDLLSCCCEKLESRIQQHLKQHFISSFRCLFATSFRRFSCRKEQIFIVPSF